MADPGSCAPSSGTLWQGWDGKNPEPTIGCQQVVELVFKQVSVSKMTKLLLLGNGSLVELNLKISDAPDFQHFPKESNRP